MKATDPIHPVVEESYLEEVKYLTTTPGIDLLTHMSIEFSKALLSSCDWNVTPLNKELMEITATKAIQQAKELIKQLNEEK